MSVRKKIKRLPIRLGQHGPFLAGGGHCLNERVRCGRCGRKYIEDKGGEYGCGRKKCERELHRKHYTKLLMDELDRENVHGIVHALDRIETFHAANIMEYWKEAGKPKVGEGVLARVRGNFTHLMMELGRVMTKLENGGRL